MRGFPRKWMTVSRNAALSTDLQTNFVMKKLILSLLLVFICLPWQVPAAEPAVLSADRAEHDFGAVKLGETRKTTFTLTASTDVVVILSASTNCECTKAAWGRKPLHKGDKSTVEVTYEAREKGYFRKNVTVKYTTGGAASTLRLTVTGNVP